MLKLDFLICGCTFYDCFYIPLSITFGDRLSSHAWLTILSVFIKLVYTVDIFINFRRGFVNPRTGIEESNPKIIAVNYLKFFFWIDLLAAIPFNFMTEVKLLALAQLVKMLRLAKIEKLMTYLKIDQLARGSLRIFYLIVAMIISFHWVGTYFYHQSYI